MCKGRYPEQKKTVNGSAYSDPSLGDVKHIRHLHIFFLLLPLSLTLPFESTTTYAITQAAFIPNQTVSCNSRSSLSEHKDRCARDEDHYNTGDGSRSPNSPPATTANAGLCPPRTILWALKLPFTVWEMPGHPQTQTDCNSKYSINIQRAKGSI